MKKLIAAAVCVLAVRAGAMDPETRAEGEALAGRMAAYLMTQQGAEGGWMHNPDGPNLPAITGLVVSAVQGVADHDAFEPGLEKAEAYMLGYVQPDGGIYDRILATYNTSICLSALAERGVDPEIIANAQRFLIGLQYSEEAMEGVEGVERVGPDHPFYGGIGYGNHSRPDGSNLHFFLRALEDSGYSGEDAAVRRAVVFLSRIQMLDETNDMAYADGSSQGGFIYATSPSGDEVGAGETKAGMIEELTPDGETVSRLRAYGSMTYAGFRAFAYAELDKDDPRVVAARGWIEDNYTLAENPGVGTDGYYYYLMTFGRALQAWGSDEVAGNDWRADLIAALNDHLSEDGALKSVDDRWMEDNPVLITAYGLIALNAALEDES